MTPLRLVQLLAGCALAEGEPVGPVLRGAPMASASRAAAAADAGRLEAGLRLVGFPEDLARLGQEWPAALRPAQQRLARIPSRFEFQLPLLQELAFFLYIALLQLVVMLVLQQAVLPALYQMGREIGQGRIEFLSALALGDAIFFGVAAVFAIWAICGTAGQRHVTSWGRQLVLAREAGLAAALLDSAAPEEIRSRFARSCQVLQGVGVTVRELELVFEHALASAEASHRRFVSALRVLGYGVLLVLAVAATVGIYLSIASFGVGL